MQETCPPDQFASNSPECFLAKRVSVTFENDDPKLLPALNQKLDALDPMQPELESLVRYQQTQQAGQKYSEPGRKPTP